MIVKNLDVGHSIAVGEGPANDSFKIQYCVGLNLGNEF